ncbi:Indoleamine 2,3-dioxygenase [Fomitiporia mediterranea MF3/22]|uniref:Indoleamine 2,3-dioxygenase n=1 Tax=Fomitiporia mediterranea (strain MF3/22) TaxID=694068 RepID=UPI0004409565|nr:Indoleamine 2,3-dioxygenase [Fomitiporia mediterranea MF3/22]EJD02196.1 Indoleamine 2,3-dioxygenase [Fomitiporia mediterranea MF3/22]
MDYLHNVLPPSELLRLGASTLSDLLARLRALGVQQPKPNSDFDISREMGFIPAYPLQRLPLAFEFWERALSQAPDVLSLGDDISEEAVAKREGSELWRQRIRERAHLVLTFLTHFYVHSIPPSGPSMPIVVPRTLAVPLVTVSRILGIAPVLTYADTVLWNAYPINSELPMTLDNLRFEHFFSGTEDEAEFYRASAGVELRGVELLNIIEEINSLRNVTDEAAVWKIARDLQRVASLIEELGDILQSVRAGCDPHVFYWSIRPWFCGADANGPASAGWIYEGVDDSDKLDLSGPSGGQSTMMHTLDVWLDIDHKLAKKRYPAPSEENKKADHSFMNRMRRYMPGAHREYLEYLESSPQPIRELARQTPKLREPYNAAVTALKKFRDNHIRTACLYVVTMSKSQRYQCPVMAAIAREQADAARGGPARGTGGTELTALLKAGRDATRRAALE